ncbi:DUF5689 domain-containing protein [Flagellimonas sp. S174]|uniref:DUF5689 domain-containing protein n=1 Tax=Flagellimonas sp. S174 TaxID=3410790 RepID=UPI003BF4E7C1
MKFKLLVRNTLFSVLFLSLSCVNTNFDGPASDCIDNIDDVISFAELEQIYQDEVIQIQEDLYIEGYVISSDVAGNFFNVLHIQDHPTNPSQGLQLEIDLRESYLFYDVGSKVRIHLKGLYLGKSNDLLRLGGTFTAFGNVSVGRLPTLKIPEHVFEVCDTESLQPVLTTIQELSQIPEGVLIQLNNIEVVDEELGNTYAEPREETLRTLQNCDELQVLLRNSGFADFQAESLPQENGSITGVLLNEGNDLQIVIRSLEDIQFSSERCPEIITEFTSNQIFISELADPDNNSGARFVELYNSSTEPLDLNLWSLRRYTNDNTEVSSTIDLSGVIIDGESTLVISPNPSEFELVYGFPPDIGVSTNSPADSNGDDNLELVDSFEAVIDVFGIIGEDGSGTNHEFEDGRAFRNLEVVQGNSAYTFSEWTIFNDTGEAGTIQQPQNAPEDFTPKVRN